MQSAPRTTGTDLTLQQEIDDAGTMQDTAKIARLARACLGLTQGKFSHHGNVSPDTIRNGEQGKRYPAGTHDS